MPERDVVKEEKLRLDALLVERGLAETRAKAQALILAGAVFTGEKKLDTKKNVVIVDVRETSEIKESGAIPGAIHIPMAQLDKRAGELSKTVNIVFY